MRQLKWSILVLFLFSFSAFSSAQKEKNVRVKMGDEMLYGTLTSVSDKHAPVVLIIPGSGPTDRNGNQMLLQANTYKLLAEGLAANGISSLRYDKLGVGESTSEKEEKDMVFSGNTKQVVAWIDYLKKKKHQNIVLLGHSEGSLIGILAAQEREISKLISISGQGRTIDKILLEQLKEVPDNIKGEAETILTQLKQGKTVAKTSPDLAAIFRESVQPYLISWIQLDPVIEIGKVKVPTLIVQGTTDLQTTVKDAELQHTGKPDAELEIIEGMNHVLKTAPKDKEENMKTYYNPKLPLHPELIPLLVKFIKQ